MATDKLEYGVSVRQAAARDEGRGRGAGTEAAQTAVRGGDYQRAGTLQISPLLKARGHRTDLRRNVTIACCYAAVSRLKRVPLHSQDSDFGAIHHRTNPVCGEILPTIDLESPVGDP